MLKKFLIKIVFDFLKMKAMLIAHPQLRQSAMVTIAEAEKLAELFLTNDLSVERTAQKIYEDSLPAVIEISELKDAFKADKAKLPRIPKEDIKRDDAPKKTRNRTNK